MEQKLKLLAEADKRGLLKGRHKAMFDEAVKRGLIKAEQTKAEGGLVAAFGAGIDKVQELGYRAVKGLTDVGEKASEQEPGSISEVVADTIGQDGSLAQWAQEGIERNIEEQKAYEPTVASYKNIDSVGDLASYTGELIAGSVPNMAAAVTPIGAATLAGGLSNEAYEKQPEGEKNEARAVASGAGQMLLERLGIKASMGQLGKDIMQHGVVETAKRYNRGELIDAIKEPGIAKRLFKGALGEGLTETGQEALAQWGAGKSLDEFQGLDEAFVGGFLVGGTLRSGSEVAQRAMDYQKKSADAVEEGVNELVSTGTTQEEAIETVAKQQYEAAIKQGFSEAEAAAIKARTLKEKFGVEDELFNAATQPENDLDIPTAARQAGFGDSDKAVGQYGDMLTSPAQESLKALDEGHNAPSVADQVNAAAHDTSPTPEDRFSPIKYQHKGELLPAENQQRPGIEKGPIEGQIVPEQAKLPTTQEMKVKETKDAATKDAENLLPQKDIIYAEDGRPAQQAEEQVKQHKKNYQDRLPQKDIVFASDESGVNVAKTGFPFKTKSDALLSKEARAARRAGHKTKAVKFADGFGWKIKDDSEQTDNTQDSDQAAVTQSPETVQASDTEQDAQPQPAPKAAGNKATVYTPSNNEIETEYQLFDVNDLIASNDIAGNVNANYPQELQPRDRTRKSSQAQLQSIAKGIKPERLSESTESDRGAPIVKDGIVESGNGRTIALKEAYRTGKADHYKQYLRENAAKYGLTTAQIEAIEQPILVRNRLTDLTVEQRQAFTVDSNRSAGIEQGPAELAKSDANLLSDDDMQLLVMPESGDVLSGDNQAFLHQFAKRLGDNESAKYRQQDGSWNSQFASRVNNAIFAKGYDDPDLLASVSESTTQESRNLMAALGKVAGKVAEVKGLNSDSGKALGQTISQAAKLMVQARRQNTSVESLTSQIDLTTQPAAEVEQLAKLLDSNVRSSKKMAAILDSMTSQLREAAIFGDQADIFSGDVTPQPTIQQVIDNAQQQTDTTTDTSASVRAGTQSRPQQSEATASMAANASASSESSGSSGRLNADSDLEALERKVSVAEWEVKDAQKALDNIANQLKEIPGWATTGRNNRDPKLGKQIEALTNKEQAAFKALQKAQADLTKVKNTLTGYKAGRLHANGMPKSQKAEQQQANAEYAEILKAIVKPGDQLHNVISETPETVIKFNAKTVKVESWHGPVNRSYLDFMAMEDGKPIEVPRARELAAQNQTKPLDSGFSLPESQQSKLDNAAVKISDKKRAAAEKLKKLLKSKAGQLNSGIDPEVMVAVAEVGALSIAEGAVKFAQWARDVLQTTRAVGIDDADVKPFLKEAYGAMSANPERYNISDDIADTMDLPRDVRKIDINSIESESNVSTHSTNVERASASTDSKQEHQSNDATESGATRRPTKQAEPETNEKLRSDREPSVSTNDGAVLRAQSVNELLDESGQIRLDTDASNSREPGRSSGNDDTRTSTKQDSTAATNEATSRLTPQKTEQQTIEKTSHKAVWGDQDDIQKSVPVLMPAQAGDVAQIENRFFGKDNPGPGFQNTNGTGTGKTFTGLGVVKRFAQMGKTNTLIMVPNDGIAQQWIQAANQFFGLDVYLLGSKGGAKSKDAGKGITIATYASVGQNNSLIKDREQFDLIVADESQKLMSGQQSKASKALGKLRAMTNHERGRYNRAKAMFSDEQAALDDKINARYKELLPRVDQADEAHNQAVKEFEPEQNKLTGKIRALSEELEQQGQFDTKVLFLSATPWAYAKNLDYSEGYLFDYTDYGDKFEGGYENAFHGHNAFYIQSFGYRWRYHKLNTPGAEVDQALMERQFHETMKNKGVVGGRTLDVDADYKRTFIKVETAAGEKLDELIEKWRSHEVEKPGSDYPDRPYSKLAEMLDKEFDYTQKMKLVEAIKAEEAVERAKDHIEMGRKVVIFHSYNVGGSFDPVESVRKKEPDLLAKFEKEFPKMTNINFGYLKRPLDIFEQAFGDQVKFYNGNVSDKDRKLAKDQFNDDNSNVKVIVVQQEAGEAGIGLHDVTGINQRVLLNIGMPVKPTQYIQIEGRIYRVGVQTDAQFENLTTGTAFERHIFAHKIAGRASTAENLAMGDFARNLKENISEGYLDAEYLPAQTKIGKGGKQSDRPVATSDWDKAKSFYYSNLKRNSKNRSAEGDDYFATPEPLGKKMVEWLQSAPGHRLLEPSVGHGAIGRWFPGTTRNRATEKSYKLTSLAQMNFPGEVDNIPFEDLNIINKFEGIAMNPPFGKGGKLAYEHISKALKHLVNGGRVVALVPDGPMANKRLDAMLADEKHKNIYPAAEIALPQGVFDRAGTGVKTKILILDRFDNAEDAPSSQYLNFESAKDVNELFDLIENVEVRERNQPTVKQVDTTPFMNAESDATSSARYGEQYKLELYGYLPNSVKDIVDKEAINNFGARPSRDEKVYFVDSTEARTDLAQFIVRTIIEAQESGIEFDFNPPAAKVRVEGEQSNDHFEYSGDTYTTKRRKEFLVTEMRERTEYEKYAQLKELAKEYGGWARGQKFMFKSEDDIKQFNAKAKEIIEKDAELSLSVSKSKAKPAGMKPEEARKQAEKFVDSLDGANGFKVRILESNAEAEKLWRMSLDGATVKGAYSPDTKTVYVIAENIDSVTDLKQTLAHEVIAHGGLDTLIGKEAKQAFIDRIKKTKGRKAFAQYWKDANNDYWDYNDDVKAEEIFSRFVESEPTRGEVKYWWQALKRWITKQLSKVGLSYQEDSDLTAMRDMLQSIVKGFKANKAQNLKGAGKVAYSQQGKKFSQTREEDTRTAKEKLGLVEQAETTLSDKIKDKFNDVYNTAKDASFWNRLNEGIFDGLAGIKQAEEKTGITDVNQQGYVSARLASGLADVLHGVYHYGAPEWRDGIIQRKADTKGLLEVFEMLSDDLNNWLAWMGAHRAEKLAEQGRENNLTAADIAELKALAQGKEALYEQVRQEYNKVNSAILDVAQQAGLLSQAQRNSFDEDYYVPFFRDQGDTDPEMDDIKRSIVEPHTRNGIAGQSAQIKKLKGGEQSTKDLLENIITRQSTLIDAALKNKAMQEVVRNLSGTEFMQPETSAEISALGQQELNQLQRVRVMINGQPKAYMVSDPALLRSLMQINSVGSQNLFNRLGRSAKRFLTAGVTLSPDFIFRNFVRDAAHAWMINKDGFKFAADSAKGLKKAFKEDEAYKDLIFSGAAFQGGYIHGADPEAAAQQMRRALRKKGLNDSEVNSYMDSMVTSGANLLEKYRGISDKVENANRLSTYEAALEAGKSKRQAAFEAKDLMDYSLKGNFAAINFFVDVLPFFNARLQGMSKLVRASKASGDDRLLKVLSANLAGKGVKVAMFSLALAAMNDEEERYQELPDWDKDMNWHFFIGDDHYRIPKPFELGIIFGTLPERLFHYGSGTQNEKDLGKSVMHAVTSTLSMNPIPQFALPAVEVVMNKSFFKGAPIEGMADQNKQAEDRYNAYTSDTAKAIGDAFNVSPKQIEHLILGYAGTIGGYALGASDILARQIMGVTAPETPVSRYPVVKSFYQGSGPKSSTKFANDFYEALDTANQAYGSYKRAVEIGDNERAKELIEKEGAKLKGRKTLAKIQRMISNLNKMQKAINDNKTLTAKQKREKLDEIQRKKNAIYHKAYVALQLGEW